MQSSLDIFLHAGLNTTYAVGDLARCGSLMVHALVEVSCSITLVGNLKKINVGMKIQK